MSWNWLYGGSKTAWGFLNNKYSVGEIIIIIFSVWEMVQHRALQCPRAARVAFVFCTSGKLCLGREAQHLQTALQHVDNSVLEKEWRIKVMLRQPHALLPLHFDSFQIEKQFS